MKVCVLGLRGIPDVVGGIETHCQQLLPRLKQIRPADDFVVLSREAYVPPGPYDHDGLKVVPLWHARGRHFEAITNALVAVFHARFKSHCEVVHIHAIGPALVAPLARALGLKVVVTHHGTDYDRAKWNSFAKWVLRMGERCAVRFSDRVIAVSPTLCQSLKQAFPRHASKIFYVPNGASHFDAHPANADMNGVLQRFGLERGNYVISVGRIVPEKGFHDLVEAYGRSGIDAKLVIVGGAEDGDPYFQKLRQNAGKNIVFTGYMGQADLAVLLSDASLFVLPSYHEGLPIAALEAASCGAPILLSDIQPNKDLGLPESNYFRVGDIDDLSENLQRDPDTFRIDLQATIERFDWDVIARQTSDVYDSLGN